MMIKDQKGFVHLFLLVVIVIIGIGGLLYYSWQKGLIKTKPGQELSPTPIISTDETVGWKEFNNENFSFTFKYPQDWLVTDDKIKDCCVKVYLKPAIGTERDQTFSNFNEYNLILLEVNHANQENIDNFLESICFGPKTCNYAEAKAIRVNNLYDGRVLFSNFVYPTKKVIFQTPSRHSFYKYIYYTFTLRLDDAFSNKYNSEDKEMILDQILSTFRFLD